MSKLTIFLLVLLVGVMWAGPITSQEEELAEEKMEVKETKLTIETLDQ